MSRPVALPAEAAVRAAMDEVRKLAAEHGRRPTVTALARQVGLTNPTFWRHFPHLARELLDAPGSTQPGPGPQHGQRTLPDQVASLKRENRRLQEHLDLAVANIARLTLDNHHLTHALQAATGVTRLERPSPG